MSKRRTVLLVILLLAVGAACATAARQRASSPADAASRAETSADADAGVGGGYEAPILPPELTRDDWVLPDLPTRQPDFPWLPEEDTERSRSVGTVTDGWLINAKRIPQPHPQVALLDVQAGRDLDYTSDEMWSIVEAAAAHVAQRHPHSVLYLGNFSAKGGGDIPYSVSHNSGRDADLAFFVTDAKGKSVPAPALLPMGKGEHTAEDGTVYKFDAARNWALVEGLVMAANGSIQYIFVSRPLRALLLAQARKSGADAKVVAKATTLLLQPGGALPHDDHLHIRLYCSREDVRSGCRDGGRKVAGYDAFEGDREEVVARSAALLLDAAPEVRVAAARRLELLQAASAVSALETSLKDDPDARVRTAAARALSTIGEGESAMRDRVAAESDARVRLELVSALGALGTSRATQALIELLDDQRTLDLAPDFAIDIRVAAADALASLEDSRPVPALIEATGREPPQVRARAHRALKMLTNHDPSGSGQALVKAWRQWHDKHGKLSRDRWLELGFQEAGFDVKKLSLANVWALCKAVLGDDHTSYNAQRVLMRLAKRDAPSLEWAKSDANFYWRRWFERRCKRLGCPPVPEGMSTLN